MFRLQLVALLLSALLLLLLSSRKFRDARARFSSSDEDAEDEVPRLDREGGQTGSQSLGEESLWAIQGLKDHALDGPWI